MFKALKLYLVKITNREKRLPGFAFNFCIKRFFKALLLLPTVPLILKLLFMGKYKTIIYRPDKRHLDFFSSYRNILIIGDSADRKWASRHKVDFLYFYPIYSLTNIGLVSVWDFIFYQFNSKRIVINSDFGLDQFLALSSAKSLNMKSWCIQHGLFPAENNQDLDGYDADINVVTSTHQLDILKNAKYTGEIKVCNQLFTIPLLQFSDINKNIESWDNNHRPIIFVGAGYTFNNELESEIFHCLQTISNSLKNKYSLVYRPHPRDNKIIDKARSIGYASLSNYESSYLNPNNLVFIGVKSTFMLEAQNAGKLVFLISSDRFPKYFNEGEITREVKLDELFKVDIQIQSYITENS